MNRNIAQQIIFLFLGISTSLLGLAIYYAYRPETLLYFRFSDFLGLDAYINEFRLALQDTNPPSILIENLPYALMVFSYMMLIFCIWGDERGKPFYLWLYLASIISIGLEILQFFKLVRGTFDIIDLISLLLATLLGSIFLIKRKSL